MSADPRRARRYGSRPDREVRRLLPRPCGSSARLRGLGTRHLRPPVLGRRARSHRRRARACCRSMTRRRARELFAREGARIAAVIIEPVPANHGLLLQRQGVSRAASRADAQARRAADLRRSDLRFPPGARRRRAALGHHAGPRDLRQGDRRRHAGRRLRRLAQDHGAPRAGRRHVPGRHAVRKSRGDERGHRDARPA